MDYQTPEIVVATFEEKDVIVCGGCMVKSSNC